MPRKLDEPVILPANLGATPSGAVSYQSLGKRTKFKLPFPGGGSGIYTKLTNSFARGPAGLVNLLASEDVIPC